MRAREWIAVGLMVAVTAALLALVLSHTYLVPVSTWHIPF